jgi:hypothetical protein
MMAIGRQDNTFTMSLPRDARAVSLAPVIGDARTSGPLSAEHPRLIN